MQAVLRLQDLCKAPGRRQIATEVSFAHYHGLEGRDQVRALLLKLKLPVNIGAVALEVLYNASDQLGLDIVAERVVLQAHVLHDLAVDD